MGFVVRAGGVPCQLVLHRCGEVLGCHEWVPQLYYHYGELYG